VSGAAANKAPVLWRAEQGVNLQYREKLLPYSCDVLHCVPPVRRCGSTMCWRKALR
jgi:hypothetical protein